MLAGSSAGGCAAAYGHTSRTRHRGAAPTRATTRSEFNSHSTGKDADRISGPRLYVWIQQIQPPSLLAWVVCRSDGTTGGPGEGVRIVPNGRRFHGAVDSSQDRLRPIAKLLRKTRGADSEDEDTRQRPFGRLHHAGPVFLGRGKGG